MKLLADRILAAPRSQLKWFERARDLLKMPDTNHDILAHPQGAVDRFVLTAATADVLADVVSKPGQFDLLRQVARSPLPRLWLDVPSYHWAFLVDGDVAIYFDQSAVEGLARFPTPVAGVVVAADSPSFGDAFLLPPMRSTLAGRAGANDYIASISARVVTILGVLSSPHFASTRRVMPGPEGDAARRAFLARNAQRGRPIFSHNQVDLLLPKTAVHNGVLRSCDEMASVRAHMRVGHWRLIEGRLDPYFVWIEGREVGNRARGYVAKTRHVELAGDSVRRGFRVPAEIGKAGERRKAEALR
ncbi:hypothetical protein FHS55_002145 [Angulomicrobium tetraedrale]|uniref:Uncharacterized protein n=1 Tax=Ancylobacter tetraedralis TaxID=217068 RepID=A0A839Z9Y8_9HYPH|nr:hypothetical protein [Ancylobacter tetraedralis]MBB3771546.1 hypothetical protein [Ancylobacter tetraedralis]